MLVRGLVANSDLRERTHEPWPTCGCSIQKDCVTINYSSKCRVWNNMTMIKSDDKRICINLMPHTNKRGFVQKWKSKNKDNSKSRNTAATTPKQLVINIVYSSILGEKKMRVISGCDTTRENNSILKTSPQKYRSYVLASFFVMNYILRIFATSMKPCIEVITIAASLLLF